MGNVQFGMPLLALAAGVAIGIPRLSFGEILLPDPTIFKDTGVYYLTGTENGILDDGGRASGRTVFPVYESSDLLHWRALVTEDGEGRLLSTNSAFGSVRFWAPQLFRHKGKLCLAYTADMRWGIAVADGIGRPFRPYVDFARRGGQSIDPFVFIDDDGRVYAYFSDSVTLSTAVVELSDDLKRMVGEVTPCVHNDQEWERLPVEERYLRINLERKTGIWDSYISGIGSTEGVTVVKRKGKYVLFYSANDYRSPDYCVGVAVADNPRGPFKKLQSGPVLSRAQTGLNGTGHGDVFFDGVGDMWYVFHAHRSDIRISPRRTGVIRLIETVEKDGYPCYKADEPSMRLL